jgi:hypothetical protein
MIGSRLLAQNYDDWCKNLCRINYSTFAVDLKTLPYFTTAARIAASNKCGSILGPASLTESI